MSQITYIGEMYGVSLDGSTAFVRCFPVALGIEDGRGLVIAEDAAELEDGLIYARPRGDRHQLSRVWYYRERRQGRLWYHDTPGATCRVVEARAETDLPFVWPETSASVVCGRENFICG